jgi:dTDP-4-dehydrorhamnose reductase
MNRIVVFGGTGMLGKALEKIRPDLICFGSEFDISKYENIEEILNSINPDIIINAAALKSEHVDSNKERSIEVNIVGSANVAAYCIKYHKKLVYISTDYVYPGKTGDYKENGGLNKQ